MLTCKDFIKAAKSVSEIVNTWEQRKQHEFFLKVMIVMAREMKVGIVGMTKRPGKMIRRDI